MDEAADVINALHEGRRVDVNRLDWKTRIKFLRLQIVAAYAGYRLLYLLGRIRDAEFMEVILSSIEDSDPLLGDALEYSLDKNVVALTSFLEAVAIFAWYKQVETRPFLDSSSTVDFSNSQLEVHNSPSEKGRGIRFGFPG